MSALSHDLLFGVRWLCKHPGFTLLAILTLGVGIGVNTAMFSVVNTVLLRPLPFPDPDRLVWMTEYGDEVSNRSVSYPNFVDWRARTQLFESMSTFRGWAVNMTGGDQPESLNARMVTAEYFRVMGSVPMMGRDFTSDDDRTAAAPVTILSYSFWQERLGADPNIVGKAITLDDKPYTVIGVMPASFQHQGPPPLWLLMGPMNWMQRDVRVGGSVVGRMKPGVTVEQARSEMNRISKDLAREHPVANAGANAVKVVSLQESITGNVRPALQLLFGAVGLVLLIACANVANLQLARAATRRKEFAMRAALGASRLRILRQLLVESLLLGLSGGILGLVIAKWAMALLSKVAHEVVPRLEGLHLSYRALAFNLGASLATGILFGIAPALRFSNTDLQETLKDSNSTTSEGKSKRLRGALVVAEVALSVALLAGAGLLVKSMVRLLNSENGFDSHDVLALQIKVSRNRYKDSGKLDLLMRQILERVKAQPGVADATMSATLPGFRESWTNDIFPEGHLPLKPGELINVDWGIVGADYFKTMRIPILRGRTFSRDEDEQGKPVVLVDENLARRFWPGEDAVGKHIKYDSPVWHEVIGVVKQVGIYGSEAKPLIKVYTPIGRAALRNPLLLIRTATGDPPNFTAAITREIHAIDNDLPIAEVATFDDVLAREAAPYRFNAGLFSVFALLALLLAATGIYGVISYSVARRTHEVGIRMALGAARRDVLRLFISEGMRLVLVGLAIGIAGALVLTRLMTTLLFGVSTTDRWTFSIVTFALTIVGLLACYLPARRATKVDPLVALRYE